MSKPIAMYLPAKGIVKVKDGAWSAEFTLDEFHHQIAFYRRMCERRKGKSRQHYQPMLDELLKVQRKIEERQAA